MYKRVIIKLSGEMLAGDLQSGYDDKIISDIVEDIITVINSNVQVSLVVGGGNHFRGRSANSKMDRCKADQVGMLATVMNAIYLSDFFIQKGIKASVMTPFKVSTFTKEYNKDEALSFLENKGVCIFAGGLGHPFFSTDTITALRGAELECDCILYAKSVDGIYDKDPVLHKDAKKFDTISYKEIIEKDLQAIDISAMNLCNSQKIESLVFALNSKKAIVNAVLNDNEFYKIATKVTCV